MPSLCSLPLLQSSFSVSNSGSAIEHRGVEPRIGLQDSTCSNLLGIDVAYQARNYKVSLLMGAQNAIDDNKRVNERRIVCYHRAVWIFIAEIIIGILIFCLLSSMA